MWDGSILKIICALSLSYLLSASVLGQDIRLHQNYSEGVHSFRWQLESNSLWLKGVQNGFSVSKTNLNTGKIEKFDIQNTTSEYLTLGEASEDERYLLALLMAKDMDHEAFLTRQFDDGEIDLSDILLVRHLLSDYILNTNYQLIMESGFGWRDEDLDQNSSYEYEIFVNEGKTSAKEIPIYSFVFDLTKWQATPLPEIEAKWGNKRVDLKWKTKEFNTKYYGYELSQAINSERFSVLDTLIVNPTDTSAIEALQYIVNRQFLDNNDSTYTFRLKGRDFLGLLSENYTDIIGKGRVGIGASPQIDRSVLLNTNRVLLEWSIYEQFADEVEEWRIYIGEQWAGPYSIDTLGISPGSTQVERPLPNEDNYFRVVAVDINEVEHSSFPMLVTHLDTTPPAIPTDLSGSIDSAGVVHLTWAENNESDFYGYKVFFGFDTTKEMTLAHNKALSGAIFQDTVGLKSINRSLYYKITSVDRRNNRSAFSKILALTKPDVIAPTEPNFHQHKGGPGQASLAWYRSSSGDVVNQRLFRKTLATESQWSLIQEWGPSSIDTSYIDQDLKGLESYAYLLTVTDSSGNTSLPSNPVVVKILPVHSEVNPGHWKVEAGQNRIIFQHNFEDQEIYEIRLFKQVGDNKPFELTKLKVGDFEFIDTSIIKGQEMIYFIQVIFDDGYRSPFSEHKVVIIEE